MKKIVKIALTTIPTILLTVIVCSFFLHTQGQKQPAKRTMAPVYTKQCSNFDGIDVSRHQGTIEWDKVSGKLPSNAFVYIKCTEGASYTDPMWRKNAVEAKKAGLLVGGYHFFRMTSSAHDQFENFKKALSIISIDLIPMVDVETSDKHSKKELQDSLQVLLNLLEKEYKTAPMIYGTQRSYNTYCAPRFNHHPLYIGRYGKNAPVVNGPSHYTVWQYTEEGELNGIKKKVDLCRFHKDKGLKDILLR